LRAANWFRPDRRLGIPLPDLPRPWDDLTPAEKREAAAVWEMIRARIPDRIRHLEVEIAGKQERLAGEPDFAACCRLNEEIAELAARINELNIWLRTEPDLGEGSDGGKSR